MNILGALNPNDITDIFKKEYKTIDFESAQDFFEEIGKRNSKAEKIRIFIITERYRNCWVRMNWCKSVKEEIFKCESNYLQHAFTLD